MIVICINAMKMIGCGRLDRSEEYRLAHNLLKMDHEIDRGISRDPETLLGQVSLSKSGD